MTYQEHLRKAAIEYIEATLTLTRGNCAEAARIAGMEVQSLYRLIGRYGINRNKFGRRPTAKRGQWDRELPA